jgi:hypothetical protein
MLSVRANVSVCIVGTGDAAFNYFKCLIKLNIKNIYIVSRKVKKNPRLSKFNIKKKINIFFIEGYKNIPLKDVPMNDLVKKLQQEFELENDKTEDIDHIWKRYKF